MKREHGLGDGLGVQAGKANSVVTVLFDELQILIRDFDFILRYLRRELRWEHYLLLLALLPHPQPEARLGALVGF